MSNHKITRKKYYKIKKKYEHVNTFNRKLSEILPMSDMRASYVAGTLIISLGLIFGLVTFAYTPTTSVELAAFSPFTVTGHISMIVSDEFGNIKAYIQTDNKVTDTFKDCILDENFGAGSACGTFNRVAIGFNGTAERDDHTSLQTEFTRGTATGASTLGITLGQNVADDKATFKKVGPVTTLTAAMIKIGTDEENAGVFPADGDTDVECSDLVAADSVFDSCKLKEVGLLDSGAGGNMYGRTVLGSQPFVKVGDTVQANYTGQIG